MKHGSINCFVEDPNGYKVELIQLSLKVFSPRAGIANCNCPSNLLSDNISGYPWVYALL